MRKRVALKILRYRNRLRYRRDQIEKAKRVAARLGIEIAEPKNTSGEQGSSPSIELPSAGEGHEQH
ncbi:MAG: hypothetical protein ONB23_05805 [candidate division KSB1 bacterium]|nr:hypothetical protein [candidate division KSB1 bacterium]